MFSFRAVAETPAKRQNAPRRGVGVVMSGGGAKGLYHIGVLEALEENGVPIDYVAGTSMGSIIAAMYASGYSPRQMREIILSGRVQEWVSGRIDPTKYMPYYRQIGASPSFINLWLDLNDKERKFQIPTALISSTQIDMALIELFSPASSAAKGDFSQLMVPFLCVAADMNERRPVTLTSGSLTEAVRSSMSIPLAFRPVEKGDMLLYDGGIYDNFPWRPLDETYHPKLLIGSICTGGNVIPDAEDSLLDQALMLAMDDTDYTLPEGRSVTIRRAVGVGMLDFDNAEPVMNAGYEDAMQQMPHILAQIDEPWSEEQYEARREAFRAKCPPLIFNDYHIEGRNDEQTAYLRDYLRADLRSSPRQRQMSFDRLRTHIYSILAGGNYTMELPRAEFDTVSQRYAFYAQLKARPNVKLTIGGNISSTAFNQAYIGVNYQTFGRVANTYGANLYLGPTYTWGTLGGRMDFYLNDPLFLTYAYTFSVKNLRHGSFGRITEINNTLPIKTSDSYGTLGLGVRLSHRSMAELKIHAGHSNYHYNSNIALPLEWDHSRFRFVGIKAEVARNTLDKFLYPTRGSDLRFSTIFLTGRDRTRGISGSNKFDTGHKRNWFGARFEWNKVFDLPAISWFSLGVNVDAVYTNHPDFTNEGATLLSMPSYGPIPHAQKIFMPDFCANRFVAGGVNPTFDLMPNFFLRTGFYAMWRSKNHYGESTVVGWKDRQMHYISEASLVYHTPIGPVNLSLIKYDLNSWKNMYLMFNFGYPIFAPKGTFY